LNVSRNPAETEHNGEPTRRDRRRERHDATRREVVDAAWDMARKEGLAALSLRALARVVGMEPQSLYTYFPSKHAIYDAMFAQANADLLARRQQAMATEPDAMAALRRGTHVLVEFATSDPERHQLLFQRTIPGFEPSEESYAIARKIVDQTRANLTAIGITEPADLDLLTALVAGLVSQQNSNDPGGDRWIRQLDRVLDMYFRETKGRRNGSR
jgi:AcrR family transcriptional regulator